MYMLLYIGLIDLTNTHESKLSGNNPKVSLAHFDDGEKNVKQQQFGVANIEIVYKRNETNLYIE